jgi:cell division protein YceG involved in septum cleavage
MNRLTAKVEAQFLALAIQRVQAKIIENEFRIQFQFMIIKELLVEKSKQEEIVYIPYTGDADSFVTKLEREGFISNKFSVLILRAILAVRGEVEPGGYAFTRGMGAVSTALALNEPKFKYVMIFDGFRKGQIAEIVGDKLEALDFGKLKNIN